MRNIKEGDTVTVLANNDESDLWALVHFSSASKFAPREFRVKHTPSDTGDMWYLEGEHDGQPLALNPGSANLGGFVKVRTTQEKDTP